MVTRAKVLIDQMPAAANISSAELDLIATLLENSADDWQRERATQHPTRRPKFATNACGRLCRDGASEEIAHGRGGRRRASPLSPSVRIHAPGATACLGHEVARYSTVRGASAE